FDEKVNVFVGGTCRDASLAAQLRSQLAKWRDNDAALHSLPAKSSFVNEVSPSSRDLSSAAAGGASALDAISQGSPLADNAKTEDTATLAAAGKGKAQLLLISAPTIQKLVNAAAAGGACGTRL